MASTTNTGSIASYTIGTGDFTLTNLGIVGSAAAAGITVSGTGDTVVNQGSVAGTSNGIAASQYLTVTNTGSGALILGGSAGLALAGGGAIANLAGGTIAGYDGLSLGAAGTVTNAASGTLSGTGLHGFGVLLDAGGTASNAGLIAGGNNFGVELAHGGSFTNQSGGTVTAAAAVEADGGTVVNDGSILSSTGLAFHQGVDLALDGTLINHATGVIAGYFGVSLDGASTVVNDGTISGGAKGVQLFDGGTLTNQSGGTIAAPFGNGLWVTGASSATVVNAGTILDGVVLSQGYLTNQSSGTIGGEARLTGGATLLNAGQLASVYVSGGSVVTNQSGGTIGASTAVEVYQSGTVVNEGRIAGGGVGVELLFGGSLLNGAGGTISSGTGPGVSIPGMPTYYTNAYTGQTYLIGYRSGRGAITNAGLITGAYGVQAGRSAVTVTDSGTIAGSTAAIVFSPGYADRLVLSPGASIVGGVVGGNGILELASAAAAGTLDSLGAQFAGFAQVTVDAGADWVLNSTDTFAAGSTLTNAGTLDPIVGNAVNFAPGAGNRVVVDPGAVFIGGVDGGNPIGSAYSSVLELASGTSAGPSTLSGFGTAFTDFSQIAVDPGAYWVFNPGVIPSGVTLTNAGTIGGSVAFDPGAGNRVVIDPGAVFLGSLDGGNPPGGADPSVLELANYGSTGTLAGLGTQITDFGQVTVDAGASWYLTNYNFAAGMTLTNAGTLGGPGGTAAVFGAGAGNRVAIDQGGVFSGTVDGGNPIGSATPSTLELAGGGAYAALSGIGTQFTDFSQVTVDAGAYWDLSGYNTIAPGATLTVSGELINRGALYGNVTLAGGTILNQAGGTITGAISATPQAAEVSNAGTIEGAVALAAGVANVVVLYPNAVFGGTVNGGGSSGTLELGASGPTAGTLTGFGTQYRGFGEIQVDRSAYWNVAGNTFAAGTTLIDAGTVAGSPDAVRFAAGAGNLVVIQSGGTFSGIVDGGNPLGTATGSELELAKGLSFVGSISGLGSQFVNFATIAVDSGTDWGIYGSNTIATGATLSVYGNLANYGALTGNVTLGGGADLRNDSLFSGAAIGTGTGVALRNFGTVLSAGTAAVSFSDGGSVYNDGGISGTNYGVRISGGYGVVRNNASVGGTAVGVAILGSGTLYNEGTVTGATGVMLGTAGGTVTNYGVIAGTTGSGVLLPAGGSVRNDFGSTISGSIGVQQTGPGAATVSNFGVIGGSGGNDSVLLHAGAANRVAIFQGATFNGVVDGGNPIGGTAVSTLELGSSNTPGVLSGLGSQYIDFGQITVDPGARWSLAGSNTIASGTTLSLDNTSLTDTGTLVNNGVITLDPSSLTLAALTGSGSVTIASGSILEVQGPVSSGETIVFAGTNGYLVLDQPANAAGSVTQLSAGNYIDLGGIDPGSVTFDSGTLGFTGGSFPLTLSAGSTFEPAVSDGNGGAEVGVLCFCPGTRIATPSGDVLVERLAVGDRVLTASGAVRPIVWIGVGQGLAVPGRRSAATPVIVRKGALGRNTPNRDLHITKGHSLSIDGVLIPVELLVNHRSILWDDRAREVTVYHVELDEHDILIANGAAAESYRDDGNRWLFRNANQGWDQPPKPPCVPVLTGGPVLDAIWRRLRDRAGPGRKLPLTEEPDLHLRVDGQRVDAAMRIGSAYFFTLGVPAREVRIVSRAAVPQELGLSYDPRCLGVALRSLAIRGGTPFRVTEADSPSLTDGFHGYEADGGFRWTDGDAGVPLDLLEGFDGAVEIVLTVACTTRYLDFGEHCRAA